MIVAPCHSAVQPVVPQFNDFALHAPLDSDCDDMAIKRQRACEHNNLAVSLIEEGDIQSALKYFSSAIHLDSKCVSVHVNRILALIKVGHVREAVEAARDATSAFEDDVSLYRKIGKLLKVEGQLAHSSLFLKHAITKFPDDTDLKLDLAEVLLELQQPSESLALANASINGNEKNPRLLTLFAMISQHQGDLHQMIHYLRDVVALRPSDEGMLMQLGQTYMSVGSFEKAAVCFYEVLRLNFANASCHFSLGVYYLMLGNWRAGWEQFEYRWRGAVMHDKPRFNGLEEWLGQDLSGKKLLLVQEQGAGDAMQFFRFLKNLPGELSQVTFVVATELLSLFSTSPLLKEIPFPLTLVDSISPEELTQSDYWVPLQSLAARLRLEMDEARVDGAYFSAPLNEPKLATTGNFRSTWCKRPRIGLVWRGNPNLPTDRWRSSSLRDWIPLIERADVHWVSLQHGNMSREEEDITSHYKIEIPPKAHNWLETAAVVDSLDLVIAVDTGVAHLAGALAKQVWMLNRATSEWRWGWKPSETVWYQNMRIFNQECLGNWKPVISELDSNLGRCRQRIKPWLPPANKVSVYQAEELFRRSQQSAAKKDYLHGRELCQLAHIMSPDLMEVTYELGVLHGMLGEHEDALKCFQTVARCDNAYSKVQKNCGLAHENLGDFERALQAYQRARAQYPEDEQLSIWIREIQDQLQTESVPVSDVSAIA
ncbi:TPR repeat-containing protein [Caballeronia calidae]|uniref:TPR repeat-containing protein n=1 Tax=Caballeronia calidae TaxID=1777139 RepID=A0A158EJS6_9BURK|nr:tetratricopeptide repeat protein [Caballeronia calidae]SAL07105.1 TPR repeat-containing protein [Caballeronia calidae]